MLCKVFTRFSASSLSPAGDPLKQTMWRNTVGHSIYTRGAPPGSSAFILYPRFWELAGILSLAPEIENITDKSYTHPLSPNVMHSIWDSPAWQSLGNFTTINGNLTFSYYIDWFNPFTNKIAGKSVSCGAIMMFCLNLSYELQFLPENTFFAGITPPPWEPTVTTITALADPIVDSLEVMWHGKVICIHCHSEGTLKHAVVLPAIGDLLAMRKALSFVRVMSHNFCLFCMLHCYAQT